MKKIILISILALMLLAAFASISRARQSVAPFHAGPAQSPTFALHLNSHKDTVDALLSGSGGE